MHTNKRGVAISLLLLATIDQLPAQEGNPPPLTLQLITEPEQRTNPDRLLRDALLVRVTTPNNEPAANTPVTFTVVEGDGRLISNVRNEPLTRSITVHSDADGLVQAFFRAPAAIGALSVVNVRAGDGAGEAWRILTVDDSLPPPAPEWESEIETDEMGVATLRWKVNSTNITHFKVERSFDNAHWHIVAVLPAGAWSFRDESVVNKITRTYRIDASN